MPLAADYREAATLFTRAAEETRVLHRPVAAAAGPHVLSGERLGQSLEDFLSSTLAALDSLAASLDDLAARASQLAMEAAAFELPGTDPDGLGPMGPR
jgi:hypothetical protein